MPWKACSVMEERIRSVIVAERGGRSMSDLCRESGVATVAPDYRPSAAPSLKVPRYPTYQVGLPRDESRESN